MGLTLISTHTPSGSPAAIEITSGITASYRAYEFHCHMIHPSSLHHFSFQVDTGTNTNYNQPIQSGRFEARHNEGDSATGISYNASFDQHRGASPPVFQALADYVGGGTSVENEAATCGILILYDPAAAFPTHFTARFANAYQEDYFFDHHTSGYIDTTTAITRIKFMMSSGNIDSGTIKMFGVS